MLKFIGKKVIIVTLATTMVMTTFGTAFASDSVNNGAANSVSINATTQISDINYSGKDITLDAKLDKIITQLKEYKAKNPKASEKQLNDYAKSLTTKTTDITTSSVYTDLDNYVNGLLNPLEQALYNDNRYKGLQCIANGKIARDQSLWNYKDTKSVQHNGNGDAFRHTLWNYGMALDVGSSFALQWSNAHENGTPDNPAIEKKMDLFNNGVGIHQASINPNPGNVPNMVDIVKARVDAGGCQRIVNGKIANSNSVGKL